MYIIHYNIVQYHTESVTRDVLKLQARVDAFPTREAANTPDIPACTNKTKCTANLLHHACASFVFACIVFCALALLLPKVIAHSGCFPSFVCLVACLFIMAWHYKLLFRFVQRGALVLQQLFSPFLDRPKFQGTSCELGVAANPPPQSTKYHCCVSRHCHIPGYVAKGGKSGASALVCPVA